MSFINTLHYIIRKSTQDIFNFYISDNNLYVKKYYFDKNLIDNEMLIENIGEYLFDIKVDNHDKIYGIATPENGEALYFYTNCKNDIKKKRLFSYEKKYNLVSPYIEKDSKNNLHIIYFFQDTDNDHFWTLFNHFFDGNKWYEFSIDFISNNLFISPFAVTHLPSGPIVFYFKDKEIFSCSFNTDEKKWTSPIQITKTSNEKIYFSVLQDDTNIVHLTWSEFIDNRIVVRYTNGYFSKNKFIKSEIRNLSNPSNCSFPSIVKIANILWTMWVQFDMLYSCYSTDNGLTWSDPFIDSKSQDFDFIRYNFFSNYSQDLNHFNANTIFGTFKPKISFIGFDGSVSE